jgi:hypothetical protein
MGIVPRMQCDELSTALLESRPFGAVLLSRNLELPLIRPTRDRCRLGREQVGHPNLATK